jgi:hypothetical protein
MSTSGSIVRSTSIVVLSELVAPRVLPVLARDVQAGGRAPRYR